MCIVDRIVYHYIFHKNSTLHAKNQLYHLERLKIEPAIIEYYIEHGAFDLYKDKLEHDFLQRYYLNTLHILFTRFDVFPDCFEEMKTTIFKYFPNCLEHYANGNVLLELLKIPRKLNTYDMAQIQRAYFKQYLS